MHRAFGIETAHPRRRAEYAVAAAYVALSVLGGVAGLWLGMSSVRGSG